jgi:hypothetical protein
MDTPTVISLTQIAANVVTAASIIILIIQIRIGGKDRRIESITRSIESYSSVLTALAQNQQLADVYYRGLRSPEQLNPAEEVQFSCFVGQLFWSWEMIFHQSADQRLAPAVWSAHVSIINDILTSEGAQLWWKNRSHWYSIQFREFIDARIQANAGKALHGWSSSNGI